MVFLTFKRQPLSSVLGLALLVQSIQGGWIDIDTPLDKRTTKSFVDKTEYELVSRSKAWLVMAPDTYF
jgi:hypothetical protein